ncbi:MAG: VanZ family protein [Candidatus Methanoperedens sp.]|nr:VanZ family protein [Candidatus Methanoperedens sp.]
MRPASKVCLLLTVLYALMIFYLSSLSDPKVPGVGLKLVEHLIRSMQHSDYLVVFAPFYPLLKKPDKVLHILLYFGFGILLFLTLKGTGKTQGMALVLAFFLGVLYGASDEFHQMFVAGRTASAMDLTADAAGVLLAQALALAVYMLTTVYSYIYARFRSV